MLAAEVKPLRKALIPSFYERADAAPQPTSACAPPWLVVRRVLFPLMLPGIIAGVAFAFTLSLDEFIITFLLAGSTQTLPLYIYTQLRTEVSPTVNAIGTLIVAAAMASILTVQLVQGLSRLRGVAARGWATPLVPPPAQKVPREA